MSELQAQPGTENPFAQGSESQPQPHIEDETGSQPLETSPDGASEPPPVDNDHIADGAERFAEPEVVHTHESVLSGLMEGLEGMAHMAKSEIEALVAHARSLFESL